ncbi:MAG: S8 family serine peptidase, partial [Planctomycetes bacterium]|nr:S8 family serine peptidase [Planctomycetota bacterium]
NGANSSFELLRTMADPARASLVITAGATNDDNLVTSYSTYGFIMPRANVGEDFKPDVVAPGGSYTYTGLLSADSGTSDGIGMDKEPNDYASGVGTSFSAPFASGCAALVIDAMQTQGIKWKFGSSDHPRFVKMILCATASETNAQRESKQFNPTLERAAAGPEGFPAGKDQHEGYGVLNADAAVEAVCQTYTWGAAAGAELGGNTTAKRVWARTVTLKKGCDISTTLTNPTAADFDLYLYSGTPSATGTPVILASSAQAKTGGTEVVQYTPTADGPALLVVKRIAGTGSFNLTSSQAGPPTAADVQTNCSFNGSVTITLKAADDGKPNPPGTLSFTVLSKPAQGRLELPGGGEIATVPAKLPADKVVYRPNANFLGHDSFTFCADDGGTAPFGGRSNTATVAVSVVKEMTVEYQIADGTDDAFSSKGSTSQTLADKWLGVGMHVVGLRFRAVKIPQGSTINKATLKICAHSAGLEADVDGLLKGEAADSAGSFATDSRIVGSLPTTTASKAWKWVGPEDDPWTANAWYESPDIAAVIQEIVNRPGWTADNALVVIYTFNQMSFGDERRFWSFNGDPAKAAKLVITYQPK